LNSSEFQQVYKTLSPTAHRIANRILKDPAEVDDAVQDAFVKAFENQKHFRGESKLSTWVYRIIVNTCNSRNLRPDRVKFGQVPLEAAGLEYDESLELWELPSVMPESDFMPEFIEKLPRRQATAIRLYYFHGHDYKRVALIMNISTSAVTSLLQRGRVHLKAIVENHRQK
jgi:RNA polymerase sigma-70 factor (ECF subfamily)